MAYDVRAESRRLIEHGLPPGPVRLSRRHRFAPVAVDVADDVAATWFVRRGVGCYWDEFHLFARDDDGWRLLGGGGGSSSGMFSSAAFAAAREELASDWIQVDGGSSVRRDSSTLTPWRDRWIHSASLLVGRAVTTVAVAGRVLRVPPHGHLVVVWGDRRPPSVSARDATGRELTTRRL
ncbi:hypothetical protein, partial [Asanoa siamensis]|uniref:hypothetical protein n=1 Tax=Asanoa siamensis TaxID=926357 RepID=UPI00194163B2